MAADSNAIPRINRRYQILSRLGAGSGGTVFRVRDLDAAGQPERALKLVHDSDPAARRRLAMEFGHLGQLEHPALARVYELGAIEGSLPGLAEGTLFFTAELVPGEALTGAVAAADDPIAILLACAEDIASALDHVHAAGLLHCDVKPSNILVAADRQPEGVGPEARTAGSPLRCTLVDLGLATTRGDSSQARGTPAYMSREAFAGAAEPRTDLYALGASLYHAAAGAPPFAGDHLRELASQVLAGAPAPLVERASWVPQPLAEFIDRLLAPSAEDRPSSAAVILDELARIREALDRPPGSRRQQGRADAEPPLQLGQLIGRELELDALLSAILDPEIGVIRLLGPDGVGRHALFERARQSAQLAGATGSAPMLRFLPGTPDQVAQKLAELLGIPTAICGASLDQFVDRLLERASRAAQERPLILALETAPDDQRPQALARAAASGHPALRGGRLTILTREPAEAAPMAGAVDIAVRALDAAQVAELATRAMGQAAPTAWTRELAELTGGLPRLVVEALRAARERGGDLAQTQPSELLGGDDALAALLVTRVCHLGERGREVAEALAVLGGRGCIEAIAGTLERERTEVFGTVPELIARGLARTIDGDLALPTAAHTEALHGAIPNARCKALHRRAAAWHRAQSAAPDPVALARHLAVAGPAAQAVEAAREAARLLRSRGAIRAASRVLERVQSQATTSAKAELATELSELATELGEYERAIAAASAAARSRRPHLRRRAELALARAQQKSGDLEAAEQTLVRLHARNADDPEAAGAYARILVSRGRFSDAAEVAGEPARSGPLAAGDALRLEAAGLAWLYQSDAARAEGWFRTLERRAQLAGQDALVGRALGLQGMAAQARGEIATAATLYERAATLARAASAVHEAAVYELNRASAHAERGRHGAALDALDQATSALARLGDVPELGAALFNRGVELLILGEIDAAGRAAERAEEVATRHGTPQVEIYASLLKGDVEQRRGEFDAALGAYGTALQRAADTGSDRDRLLALANLAEVHAKSGTATAAAASLEQAAAIARTADDRDRLSLCRARVALALGTAANAQADELRELDDTRQRLRASGRLDQAWRADVIAARLARAVGDDDRARERLSQARDLFGELLADTPEALRAGFASDPDAMALTALSQALSTPSSPPANAGAPAARDLRRLLALSRRLNSELRLAPLLDQVIDTAIELTSAERGFLLLLAPDSDRLDITVARHFAQQPQQLADKNADGELAISRSIAERTARTGEVVLTIDAAFDERFGAAESVAAMRLRSVLAVPLRQKGRISGTIYLDHRFRSGAFDEEAIELTRELADIAAIAIENARLVEENRERASEIAELNRKLSEEVVEAETELATVKARYASGQREGLRHAYDAIIGSSQAVVDMLALLDRATDTNLPVVIVGESGTGKELVARALHENSSRRGEPFVAINCGAVPEPLLESELFGHVRGAFTGADRDRRGMFEVAHGGTLLLDEVADTGPAMQAKLLRVLQEGEIRRLGDARTRAVNVRVVAATNRPLDELVASGAFREDLYYRLSVLAVTVPPLRDRIEDLPALARHILGRITADLPELPREVLTQLAAYRWPGNIRELENELARAYAMSDGAIDEAALSDRVRSARSAVHDPQTAIQSDDLSLKPRVEALERALVEEAMVRTRGNQTAAAKILGLSRYGLQKKLKRYGISAPAA